MSSPLENLAASITKSASTVAQFLRQTGHAQPSFAPDAPARFPVDAGQDVVAARNELIYAARQLQFLALGPTESLQWFALTGALDTASLRWLRHYEIPAAVPLDSSISFADLADKVHLSERTLTRIVRHAMTNNIFVESPPEHVSHTSLSIQLARTENPIRGVVGHQSEVVFPAAAKMVEAHELFGTDEESATHAPFQLAFDTKDRALDWVANDPVASARFAESMKGGASSGPFSVVSTVKGFDWSGLGEAVVVDVGGSAGQASKAIAATALKLRFIVQDLPSMASKGRLELESELQDRFTFQDHDFFNPNPVQNPDVFLLRFILHDWPDQDVVKILQQLIPSVGPKTRMLISDIVTPAAGSVHPLREKYIRNMDMMMMSMFNSLERSRQDWEAVIARADARLKIVSINTPEGSGLSMIEVVKEDL